MQANSDIVRWAEGPIGFYVDRTYDEDRGVWVLGNTPITLAGYHADLLRHLFTPDERGRLPYDVVGWCEPAKSGKSAIAGLVGQYMALYGDPNSTVVMASNKRDQAASVMYKSFTDSVKANQALAVDAKRYQTTLPNGTMVKAIPSNSSGEAGARFSVALFDELWAYQYVDAVRLWSEFKTDPTRTNSMRFALGYGGYTHSELWQEVLEAGMKGKPVPELAHIVNEDGSPTCYANGRQFTFWSHTCRQPWQTEEWIESNRASLRPPEFQRMIKTEFVEGEGTFVDQGDWEACIDPHLVPLDMHPWGVPDDVRVFVGLDLALAPGGDDAACIGVYYHEGHACVAFHRVWKGSTRLFKLKLDQTVKPYILDMAKRHNIEGVYFDPWQASLLADQLRQMHVTCREVSQTRSSRAPHDTRLYEAIVNQELALYPDKDLRTMALGASAVELGNELLFLKKAGRAKIDLLIALSNCLLPCLKRKNFRPTASTVRYA